MNAIEQFRATKPFPYLLLKDLWPDQILQDVIAEFPKLDDPRWATYPLERERGKKAGGVEMWGAATKMLFAYLRGPVFIARLTEWTGIEGLVADTLGGGLHCTGEGGRLGMHVDFSVHPQRPTMTRRINLLIFLNAVWEREWGGTLYLGAEREVAILPLLNSTVIFETSSKSLHGHPEPIVGDHKRMSLACYFYAPRRPDDDLIGTTVWQDIGPPPAWDDLTRFGPLTQSLIDGK